MVTRYGMSEVLGKVSVNYDDMGQSLSSETRALVESEVRSSAAAYDAAGPLCCVSLVLRSRVGMQVKRLLNGAYERAQAVLKNNEHELHALAKQLLEQESMTGAQIKDLLQKLKKSSSATSVAA